jgi:hypothetical protein
MSKLVMKVMDKTYAICKLKSTSKIPSFLLDEAFVSITRTQDELSIVCSEGVLGEYLDDFGKAEVFPNWGGLMVEGPLDFSLIGILSQITKILADASISVFAISTFDTDYILLNNDLMEKAVEVLRNHDIEVIVV